MTLTILPPAHEVCCKLFFWVGGIFGKWGHMGIVLHEPGDRLRQHVRLRKQRRWTISLVEFRNKLLEVTDHKEAAIRRPLRLAHFIAFISGKYHSEVHEPAISPGNHHRLFKQENTYPGLTAFGSFSFGAASRPSICG